VTLCYQKIREAICDHLKHEAEECFEGEVELDESYFGGRRKEKRGRGGGGTVIAFGILNRGGKVYTKVPEDTKTKQAILWKDNLHINGVESFWSQAKSASRKYRKL